MHALYISQTGLTEPLAQSQVLPYLRGLTARGWTFDVATLEPSGADPDRIEQLRRTLAHEGIHYLPGMRSSSGSKLSKVGQIATLLGNAGRLALMNRPQIIHARSDLPAVVAVTLGKVVPGAKSIYDCRGFLADEYADFGHWTHESMNYRGLRWSERQLYRHADAVVTLTENAKHHLTVEVGWIREDTPCVVIPCCVDTSRFAPRSDARSATRTALGVGDELLVSYAGTLGSWYCEEEMARLFVEVLRHRKAKLLVLTRSSSERLERALAAEGVAKDRVIVRSAAPSEMAALLAGSDVGISFAKPAFSKRASSPVKMAEYLSVGSSLVLNRGVGDADSLLAEDVCFDAADLSSPAIARVAVSIAATSFDENRRQRARAVAVKQFDLEHIGIERYAQLYRSLATA